MLNRLSRITLLFIVLLTLSSSSKLEVNSTAISASNTRFALDMLKEFKSENSFVSPFSISTAMAMTYAGANGKTAREFEEVLYFNNTSGDFHQNYGQYQRELTSGFKNVEWSLANRLWGQNGYSIKDEFLRINKEDYNAPIEMVAFGAEPTRLKINKWVESNTNNRIKDLIPPGALTIDTRLVLTNAVFFKGDWEYQFKKSKTKKEDFALETNDKVKVDMMFQKGGFNYSEGRNYQAVQLPYKSSGQSMVIFLPKEGVKVNDLQGKLSVNDLARFKNVYPSKNVKVYLPKFKMEYKMDMNKYFIDKGMTTAFSASADFSGISEGEKIWISKVLHKAFVEVGEEGTEAAAATAVVVTTESTMPSSPPKDIVFKADHPFLFFIMDHTTSTILFMGKVMNPSI